jgi:hypothetical protein
VHNLIAAADNEIKSLLLNAELVVWQHAAHLLEEATFMPGGCFTLELTSNPPRDASIEEINKGRDVRSGVHADSNSLLFDAIVSQTFGAVIPGVSVHRFGSMNEYAIRGAGLMQSWRGHAHIAARVAVRPTKSGEETAVIKWSMTDSSKVNASLNHERKVLMHLRDVPGVVNLFQNGGLESNIIHRDALVTHEEYSHPSNYETLNVYGLFRLGQRGAHILNDIHRRDLCHNNVSTLSLRLNPIKDRVCLISMQYVSLIPSAGDDAKRIAAAAGIAALPKAPPSRNLPWFDKQILSTKTDSLLFGCTMLSCMKRDSGFFLTRGAIDLSKLGDGSDLTLVRLIGEAVSEFNRYIAKDDPRLEMGTGLVEVVQGLLRKDPNARISCGEALQMIAALRISQQPEVQTLQVPAKYCKVTGEMHRPYEIFTKICMDQQGNEINGYGLRAIGKGVPGDLICAYFGTCVDQLHADILSACNQGHSIKNLNDIFFVGGLKQDTIQSLNWLVENGAASLANCSTKVSSKIDECGHTFTLLEPTPATAYFDIVTFPSRKLPIPGNVWSNAVHVLRVATNVSDGEEYVVSYGTRTTQAMFVSPGHSFVICNPRKRAKPNQANV